MSRFNSEAYDRLYPRVEDPVPVQETAVETFRPSQEKVEADPVVPVKVETVLPELLDPELVVSEGGVNDGDGEYSKPDIE